MKIASRWTATGAADDYGSMSYADLMRHAKDGVRISKTEATSATGQAQALWKKALGLYQSLQKHLEEHVRDTEATPMGYESGLGPMRDELKAADRAADKAVAATYQHPQEQPKPSPSSTGDGTDVALLLTAVFIVWAASR